MVYGYEETIYFQATFILRDKQLFNSGRSQLVKEKTNFFIYLFTSVTSLCYLYLCVVVSTSSPP